MGLAVLGSQALRGKHSRIFASPTLSGTFITVPEMLGSGDLQCGLSRARITPRFGWGLALIGFIGSKGLLGFRGFRAQQGVRNSGISVGDHSFPHAMPFELI